MAIFLPFVERSALEFDGPRLVFRGRGGKPGTLRTPKGGKNYKLGRGGGKLCDKSRKSHLNRVGRGGTRRVHAPRGHSVTQFQRLAPPFSSGIRQMRLGVERSDGTTESVGGPTDAASSDHLEIPPDPQDLIQPRSGRTGRAKDWGPTLTVSFIVRSKGTCPETGEKNNGGNELFFQSWGPSPRTTSHSLRM